MKNKKQLMLAGALLVAVALAFLFWNAQTNIIRADTTIEGDHTVEAGKTTVLKNGAKLTVTGNLTVDGVLRCESGALSLTVGGTLTVNGAMVCVRDENLAEGDPGHGMQIVAKGVNITADAKVGSNGSVQLTDNPEKLATTAEEIGKLYDEAGTYTSEGKHIGPFIPFEEIPEGVSGKPTTAAPRATTFAAVTPTPDVSGNRFIPVARAQEGEPAVDAEGNPVGGIWGAVRIGGTWVIGQGQLPPFDLTIPRPPKGVKKIVLNFDFGDQNGGVQIADFTLTGPDGAPGTAGEASCTSTGGKGEDAMRFNVRAARIRVNNFTIHLGAGGEGGRAETSKDCDPGVAKGGEGGASGNLKFVADDSIEIEGAFNIFPGRSGNGGEAIAHGKTGADGCAGEKGGDAVATGGTGGDNKKGLMVSGAVSGTENMTIHDITAGDGGNATANGGTGGNGTGPGCAGGPGGKATATGGKGGAAQSVRAQSFGGNGGDASANPGTGGNGGQGSQTEEGGNGGKGGDAEATEGEPGTGTTAPGNAGVVTNETGGNGGNGGDGCNEGGGGPFGLGNPNGTDGLPGKNLCVGEEAKEEGTSTMPDNDEDGDTPTDSFFDVFFEIQTKNISHTHIFGGSSCPDPIMQPLVLRGTPGSKWQVNRGTVPPWLTIPNGGTLTNGTAQIPLAFNCNITNFNPHSESGHVGILGISPDGMPVGGEAFFDVNFTLQVP